MFDVVFPEAAILVFSANKKVILVVPSIVLLNVVFEEGACLLQFLIVDQAKDCLLVK